MFSVFLHVPNLFSFLFYLLIVDFDFSTSSLVPEKGTRHHESEVKVKLLSRVQLFVTPWTVAYQAPLSVGFSRQEYWSGLPFPSPGDLPNPEIEPGSSTLQADALPSEPPGKPVDTMKSLKKWTCIYCIYFFSPTVLPWKLFKIASASRLEPLSYHHFPFQV